MWMDGQKNLQHAAMPHSIERKIKNNNTEPDKINILL